MTVDLKAPFYPLDFVSKEIRKCIKTLNYSDLRSVNKLNLKVGDCGAEVGADGGAEPAVVVVGGDVNLEGQTASNIPEFFVTDFH